MPLQPFLPRRDLEEVRCLGTRHACTSANLSMSAASSGTVYSNLKASLTIRGEFGALCKTIDS